MHLTDFAEIDALQTVAHHDAGNAVTGLTILSKIPSCVIAAHLHAMHHLQLRHNSMKQPMTFSSHERWIDSINIVLGKFDHTHDLTRL